LCLHLLFPFFFQLIYFLDLRILLLPPLLFSCDVH
jgi:hypothetical protein